MKTIDDFLPVDTALFREKSGNLYRSIRIVTARSNQLTLDLKDELSRKLAEFAPAYDNLEEISENKEQIEISRFYERKPKPNQVALFEFLNDQVHWEDPNMEVEEEETIFNS